MNNRYIALVVVGICILAACWFIFQRYGSRPAPPITGYGHRSTMTDGQGVELEWAITANGNVTAAVVRELSEDPKRKTVSIAVSSDNHNGNGIWIVGRKVHLSSGFDLLVEQVGANQGVIIYRNLDHAVFEALRDSDVSETRALLEELARDGAGERF